METVRNFSVPDPAGKLSFFASPGPSVRPRAQKNVGNKPVTAPGPDSFNLGPRSPEKIIKILDFLAPWGMGDGGDPKSLQIYVG